MALAALERSAAIRMTCCSLIAMGLALPAAAQTSGAGDQSVPLRPTEAPAPAATDIRPPASPDVNAGEIVITAERRAQRLQDVPIAATVLSANDLVAKGVSNVADLQNVAPSLAINTYNRSTFINIRGVGTAQSISTGTSGVAFYLDGEFFPHDQFIGQSFYDIGTVEVLRGPQGTLTGQNSTGGAIYVRTPDPKFGAVSGYVDQTVGNYDWYRTVAAVNVPVGDNVAVRASGVYEDRDSFTKNIGSSPSHPGDANLLAGRINVGLKSPNGDIRLNLRASTFHSNTDFIAVKRRGDTISIDPFVIEEDAISYQRQDGYRVAGELRAPLLTGVDLRVFGDWQDLKTVDQSDGDRSNTALPQPPTPNIGRVAGGISRYHIANAEVNLISSGDGAIDWVLGAYYLNDYANILSRRDNRNTVNFVSATAGFTLHARAISTSGFGQFTWRFADHLELLAGGRYSWDKQLFDRISINNVVTPAAQVRSVPKSEKLTGKVALNYKPDRDTLIYASASRGYKAGGGNVTIGVPDYRPETNTVYELGLKASLLNRHLRFSTDIFHSNYKGIQLTGVGLNGLSLTQNAASARSWGAEFEGSASFGGLGIDGGISYLRGEFHGDGICIANTNRNTPTVPTPPVPAVACPTGTETVPDGRRLPFSPKWTINAGIQYAVPLADRLTLTPRLQWAHLASQVATPFPSTQTIVPGRNVFDARLTLDIGDRFQVQGFVTNFTNKVYIASQLQDSSTSNGGYIYGAPRQFGVRGVVKFGG